MKDVSIELASPEIRQGEEIRGTIRVGYPGGFDGVVINAQVLDSNELVTYRSCNGRQLSNIVSRLFVDRAMMPENRAEFAASTGLGPGRAHDVKFRASIIEQHKEIGSDVVFAKFPG